MVKWASVVGQLAKALAIFIPWDPYVFSCPPHLCHDVHVYGHSSLSHTYTQRETEREREYINIILNDMKKMIWSAFMFKVPRRASVTK